MVLPAAMMMASGMAFYVAFILGMCGYQWIPTLHIDFFFLLSIQTYFVIVTTSITSPFTDPSKGMTGVFEGSCGLFDFWFPSKDDIMALFDGRNNPVLAVSAVMLCIVSLVKPPSCGSRWVWVSAWLALAVILCPFSGIEARIS